MGIQKTFLEKLRKIPLLAELASEKGFQQLKRYLVSGFTAFGLEYMIFYLLYHTLGLGLIPSNTFAMIAGFITSFLLNRFWSFQSSGSAWRQLLLTGILFGVNLVLSNGLIYLLTDFMNMAPLVSKILVMGMIVAWNFILYKRVIYR
jgi:putative flippase GtrA